MSLDRRGASAWQGRRRSTRPEEVSWNDPIGASAFDLDLAVHATAPRPGTLDAAIEYLTGELGMRIPLHELFAADLPKKLAPARDTVRRVRADTIAGVATDQVFFRREGGDVQVWIASQGDPLPRRIVITYRQEEGQPPFRADPGRLGLGRVHGRAAAGDRQAARDASRQERQSTRSSEASERQASRQEDLKRLHAHDRDFRRFDLLDPRDPLASVDRGPPRAG